MSALPCLNCQAVAKRPNPAKLADAVASPSVMFPSEVAVFVTRSWPIHCGPGQYTLTASQAAKGRKKELLTQIKPQLSSER